MKYKALPITVEAFVVENILSAQDGSFVALLDNGKNQVCDSSMSSRFMPKIGDYFVIQKDGYVYFNPKSVFERKYTPVK